MAWTRVPVLLIVSLLAPLALACSSQAPAPGATAPAAREQPVAAAPAAPPSPVASAASPTVARMHTVRVGVLSSTTDAGNWIGLARGYFEQEGIQLELTRFGTAAEMVAPLGTGQLDAGGGSPGVGLTNAILRGVDVRIVADRSNSAPGHGYSGVLARKDLYDRGEIQGPADLKGRRLAISSTTGIVSEVLLHRYMQRAGLRARDAELIAMSFPDMVPAFANRVIDAGWILEPFLTQVVEGGDAVALERVDTIFPDHQDGVVLYSGAFAQQQDPAIRYLVAYLRGVRDYNDAFVKKDPAKRAEVIDILAQYTPVKEKQLYDKMLMPGLDPNGRVNAASLKEDQDYYLSAGLQERPIDIDRLLDPSFVEAAVQRLGRYQ